MSQIDRSKAPERLSRRNGREQALDFIKANPGATSAQIRSHIDPTGIYDRCIVAHNLTSLFRLGLVKREQIVTSTAVAYAYTAVSDDAKEGKVVTKAEQLLELIANNCSAESPLTCREITGIAVAAGMKEKTVGKVFQDLYKAGALDRMKVPERNPRNPNQDAMVYAYWVSGGNAEDEPLDVEVDQEWARTGLPPVGIECEVTDSEYRHPFTKQFSGKRVTIVAHAEERGDPVAVFRVSGLLDDHEARYHALIAGCFRPIRTPEQIAAEEREKAIDAMWIGLTTQHEYHTQIQKQVCAELYDAGYRKVEGGAE